MRTMELSGNLMPNTLTHWLLETEETADTDGFMPLPLDVKWFPAPPWVDPKLPKTVAELNKLYSCYYEGIQAALAYQFPPNCPYTRGIEYTNAYINWEQLPEASAWFAGYWKQSRSMPDFAKSQCTL